MKTSVMVATVLVQIITAKCGGCHTMVHGVPGYTQSEEEVGQQIFNNLLFYSRKLKFIDK